MLEGGSQAAETAVLSAPRRELGRLALPAAGAIAAAELAQATPTPPNASRDGRQGLALHGGGISIEDGVQGSISGGLQTDRIFWTKPERAQTTVRPRGPGGANAVGEAAKTAEIRHNSVEQERAGVISLGLVRGSTTPAEDRRLRREFAGVNGVVS